MKNIKGLISLILLSGVGLVFGNFFGAFAVPGMEQMPTFEERKNVRMVKQREMNIRNGLTPEGKEKKAEMTDNERRTEALKNGGGV